MNVKYDMLIEAECFDLASKISTYQFTLAAALENKLNSSIFSL